MAEIYETLKEAVKEHLHKHGYPSLSSSKTASLRDWDA